MSFNDFYIKLSEAEKQKLAESAGTSTAYLYQITTGRRNAGLSTIKKLVKADNRINIGMFDPDLS